MYILFYFAIWYAHKVIKRIEKKNREMLATVERNRSRLDDIIALKNKRAEYEEVVIKAKGDQKITTKQLDLEMRRLSSELVSTMSKLNELEKFLTKMIFSGNFGRIVPSDRLRKLRRSRANNQKDTKIRRTHSKTLRYSSRRSRRRCRPSRHRASSGSLRDHPRLQPPPLRTRPRKSDSSNRASAETSSSTESSCRVSNTFMMKYHMEQGDRKQNHSSRYSSRKSAPFDAVKKLPSEIYGPSAPFTRPIINISPIVNRV
ncbi:uncharacterized protein LOC100679844 isoform X2 [Nasonia vitripennis]|nr:uncharacterized protein LOC100679844 isoform X2 [Nasonia vitripennis]